MYKMNLLLKFIIVILTLAIVAISNNRIVLWLLLFVLTFYNFFKNNKVLLFIDLVLVFLLGLSTKTDVGLILFKIIFIINYLITVYLSLSLEDKKVLVKENHSEKEKYFEDNFDKIVKNINEKKNKLYDKETPIDGKIERELERKYLQSRIRYYGINFSNNSFYKWTKIDTMILLLAVVLFALFFILR